MKGLTGMTHPITGRRWTRLAVLLALGAALAVSALGAGQAQAAALPTLALNITGSGMTVSGAPQSGAVNVVATETGLKEASAILLKLAPGVSEAEVLAFFFSKAVKDPNNVSRYGSIVFDAEATPGKGSEAQTSLTPGRYMAVAVVGEGAPKGHASFMVNPASAPVALPAPAAVERTIDFAFRGPSTLHQGELVRFENEGFVVHMDIAFPVKSRKAARLLAKYLARGNEKKAGKLIAGPPAAFAGPISHGGFQQETITARPGWYVQACFMDTQDGRSHTLIGMERIIKITR
jgi:hypothetical protein